VPKSPNHPIIINYFKLVLFFKHKPIYSQELS